MTDIVLIFLHVVLIYTNELLQKIVFLKFLFRGSWKFQHKKYISFQFAISFDIKVKIENNTIDDHELVSDTDLLVYKGIQYESYF